MPNAPLNPTWPRVRFGDVVRKVRDTVDAKSSGLKRYVGGEHMNTDDYFEGICANTTFIVESKDPNVLLPELLPFIMQTEAFNEYSVLNSKGSVNPYINFSDLARYEFALPPLAEQRRIARTLQVTEMNLNSLIEAGQKAYRLWRALSLREFGIGKMILPRKSGQGDKQNHL